MKTVLARKGEILPYLRVATVGGTSFALNELGGRPAVIFLWGSWDASRKALPALRERATENGPHIVTLALDAQGPAFAMRYLKGPAAPWHLLIDACALVSRVWGIKNIPAALLVDAEGRLQQIEQLPEPPLFDAAAALPRAERPGPWARADSLEAADPKVEVLVQGCGTLLSRRLVDDAAESLRHALQLDPQNEIIRTQISALKHPEQYY